MHAPLIDHQNKFQKLGYLRYEHSLAISIQEATNYQCGHLPKLPMAHPSERLHQNLKNPEMLRQHWVLHMKLPEQLRIL